MSRPLLVGELASLGVALPLALIAVHAPVVVIAGGMFFSSLGVTFADALWHTTLQQHVPEEAISRVSAIDWTSTLALSPIGSALIGGIGVAIGSRESLAVAAVLTLLSVLVMISLPSVRNLRAVEPHSEGVEVGQPSDRDPQLT